MTRVRLDQAATTSVADEVIEAMDPWWRAGANAASAHTEGRAARAAVEGARAEVASLLGVGPREVVFTSGATEAHQLGLRGRKPRSVAVAAGVHPSLREAAASVVEPVVWPLDGAGQVIAGVGRVDWICVESAHHETGILQADLDGLRGRGRLHLDLCVGLDRVPPPRFDQAVLAAHKLRGPQGIGALAGSELDALVPLWRGGAQERGLRPGTVPVALTVGFGVAALRARANRAAYAMALQQLDDRLVAGLLTRGARIVGGTAPRVPGHLGAVFPSWRGDVLAAALDLAGVAVSAGAACASGAAGPSAALQAMGDPAPEGLVRISLGAHNGVDDVLAFLGAVDRVQGRAAPRGSG